jgi:hypothetical protein
MRHDCTFVLCCGTQVNSALKDQFKSPEGLFGIRGEGAGVDAVSSLIASLVAVTAMNPIDVVRYVKSLWSPRIASWPSIYFSKSRVG